MTWILLLPPKANISVFSLRLRSSDYELQENEKDTDVIVQMLPGYDMRFGYPLSQTATTFKFLS